MFRATIHYMKTDEDRGPVGAWARNARLAAGYRTAREAAEAANRAGIALKLQHFQGIESGWDRAGRELLLSLGRFYGSDPPVDAPPSALSASQVAEIRAVVAAAVGEAFDARLERRARSSSVMAR